MNKTEMVIDEELSGGANRSDKPHNESPRNIESAVRKNLRSFSGLGSRKASSKSSEIDTWSRSNSRSNHSLQETVGTPRSSNRIERILSWKKRSINIVLPQKDTVAGYPLIHQEEYGIDSYYVLDDTHPLLERAEEEFVITYNGMYPIALIETALAKDTKSWDDDIGQFKFPYKEGTFVYGLGFCDAERNLLYDPMVKDELKAMQQTYPQVGQALLKWVRDNKPAPFYADYENKKLERTVNKWQQQRKQG